MNKYICSICGKGYNDLSLYLNCVRDCGYELEKKLKKEKEEAAKREAESKKCAEEVNAALNGIKQAKAYYEQKLNEFKEKYPEEYVMNFGNDELNDVYGNRHDEDYDPCADYDGCWSDNCGGCKEDDCECRIDHCCKGDGNCPDVIKDKNNVKAIEFSYTNNGKDKPNLSAKVNGVKVDDDHFDELLKDPSVYHIAKILGIL